jgi:hypothetical protein
MPPMTIADFRATGSGQGAGLLGGLVLEVPWSR